MYKKLICRLLITWLLVFLPATNSIAGWEVQWIDQFDGSGVNWSDWTAQVQANFNNEVQCYTDDESSANPNFDVSGGTLKIIARRQNVSCAGLGGASRSWTSGRINSKDKQEFLYGRIESRIRFLDLQGGTWPAFWMLENRIAEDPIAGDNDFINWPNPGAGEIDVWEWFSNSPTTYITNFFNTGGCGSEVRYTYPGGAADVQQWHDYAIEWDADEISFYVDDTLVVTQNVTTCAQYKEPMFVLLNVAMGGNLGGTIDPALNLATMEVDYIAHCTATSSNGETRCNESTPSATPVADNLVIFADVERADWAAWDCCGGSVPAVVIDSDPFRAEAMSFTINGNAVTGFTTRSPVATAGIPFDASSIVLEGTVEFDLKMTASSGATDWKLKLESVGTATEVEVSLTSSLEAHPAPELDIWQHYSFNLSDLAAAGLDLSAIDILLVYPEWGTGDGAEFRLDNVRILNNIVQQAPVITSSPATAAMVGSNYSYILLATDGEGDSLTLAAPVLPTWLIFNDTNGALTGIADNSNIGEHEVALTVSDGVETVVQQFTITVAAAANSEPVITSNVVRIVDQGDEYRYTLTADDSDNDTLLFSVTSLPDWLTFDAVSGLLSGTATDAGRFDVELEVSDGINSVMQNFAILVVATAPTDESSDDSGGGGNIGLLVWWLFLGYGWQRFIWRNRKPQ